jgi:hypothetical protein
VTTVTETATALSVDIVGAPEEEVELVFANSKAAGGGLRSGGKPSSVVCKVGGAGTATATFDGSAAKCA